MKRGAALVCLIAIAAIVAFFWEPIARGLPGRSAIPPGNPTLQIRHDLPARFSPPVRVNLTPTPSRQIRISVDGAYVVRPVGSEQVLGRAEKLFEADVTATPDGIRLGETQYLVSRLEIVPDNSPAVWVNDHKYRGSVRLYRRAPDTLIAINVVALEDYIASVIDSEMPLAFPDEARRAQAIVARTYVLYQMRNISGQSLFDVYATTRSQKYLGAEYRDTDGRRLAGESSNSRQIALATEGMVCTWQGEIFCTYFSAVCGGQTTDGRNVFTDAAEPLQSVPCTWCQSSEQYRWTVSLTRAETTAALKKHFEEVGKPFGSLATIAPAKGRTPLVPDFEVSDGRNHHTVSSTALRRHFPSVLPSPRFAVKGNADRLIFEGRGSGHGVGMCQWGARGMAEAGKNCLEILDYYYPGAQVVVVDSASR